MSFAAKPRDFDAVIIGAGFAGICMLHRLRERGLSAKVFERGNGVGGTWFWNCYPGARCDVESMEYSYQFSEELQQEWEWTERFATQPEILRYLNHVVDRFDFRRDIQLNARVTSAAYDEAANRWTIRTAEGDCVSAKFCIMATGCLSSTNTPKFKGLESFAGATLHTGDWPRERVDFSGKRVGVIGTGSSGVQAIPLIAEEARHLFVFQRTPAYSIPARNHPLAPSVQQRIKADYADLRRRGAQSLLGWDARLNERSALEAGEEERQAEYEARWTTGGLFFYGAYLDLLSSKEANDTAAEFLRAKIRGIVHDPVVAEALSPRQAVGCKRLCVDTGYFETFNRRNVTLVDVRKSPIEEITEQGLRTRDKRYELDSIVFATGFDAMTGALMSIDIRGRAGISLEGKWAEGPRTYLGVGTAGFPNLFIMTGPGSPSVLSNMVPAAEQHANWISRCIDYMRVRGMERIEPAVEAENQWVSHVNDVAAATLFPSCNSWYLGANVPGKPRVFMPYLGFPAYVEKCDEVAARGYEGFTIT